MSEIYPIHAQIHQIIFEELRLKSHWFSGCGYSANIKSTFPRYIQYKSKLLSDKT